MTAADVIANIISGIAVGMTLVFLGNVISYLAPWEKLWTALSFFLFPWKLMGLLSRKSRYPKLSPNQAYKYRYELGDRTTWVTHNDYDTLGAALDDGFKNASDRCKKIGIWCQPIMVEAYIGKRENNPK